MALKKISKNVPLSNKVGEQIKEAILKKVFKPGERLPSENELAETLGVSRTAVREAIHRLTGEGLIKTNGRYGIYVSGMDVSSVVNPFANLMQLKFGKMSHLYLKQARISFEPEIARLAAKMRSEENLEELKCSLQKMIETKEDRSVMIVHDINFHRILASSTDNPIMPLIMEPVFSMLGKFIKENFQLSHAPDTAILQHQEVLKYVDQQKEQDAYDAMTIHMQTAEKHLLEHNLKDA